MLKAQLIATPVCKRYVASRLSFAYLLKLGGFFLAIVIPYILSLSPKDYPIGIWLKRDAYREQPEVHFQYKLIVVAQVKDSKGSPKELYYSTMREVNEARPETFRAASVSSQEIDYDLDGLVDQLMMNITVPLLGEQVYGVQVLIFLNYRLQRHVKINMDSLAFIQNSGALPTSSYSSRGDLILRQNFPMRVKDSFENLYLPIELVTQDTEKRSRISNIMSILKEYETRDIATHYLERFSYWGGNSQATNQGTGDTFDLSITIDIPRLQQVIFIPTLPQVLLEAWTRYLSMLVLSVYTMRKFLFFIYTNRIVWSQTITDNFN